METQTKDTSTIYSNYFCKLKTTKQSWSSIQRKFGEKMNGLRGGRETGKNLGSEKEMKCNEMQPDKRQMKERSKEKKMRNHCR